MLQQLQKPPKPYPDFPLYAHGSGQWAKKIRGSTFYFGPWRDWKAAAARYESEREALYLGIDPDTFNSGTIDIDETCNRFLDAKLSKVAAGDLGQRMYDDYKAVADKVIAHFGRERCVDTIQPSEWDQFRQELAKKLGAIALKNQITRIKAIFKFAYDAGYLVSPVKMSPEFKPPSARAIRVYKAKKPAKLFSATELNALIAAARQPINLMIRLAINCGFGNLDCSMLLSSHVELGVLGANASGEAGESWIRFPRNKTGIARVAYLWPDTAEMLRPLLGNGLQSTGKRARDRQPIFRTTRGNPWSVDHRGGCTLSHEFKKLCEAVGIYKERRGFNAIRHTFATVAGNSGDQVAVDYVMGHVPSHISAAYRHAIDDSRVRAVCEFVRNWLNAAVGSTVKMGTEA